MSYLGLLVARHDRQELVFLPVGSGRTAACAVARDQTLGREVRQNGLDLAEAVVLVLGLVVNGPAHVGVQI